MPNKMDAAAAALLEGLWPLENEGLETAVVEEHERERLKWHGEPLLLLCDVVSAAATVVVERVRDRLGNTLAFQHADGLDPLLW